MTEKRSVEQLRVGGEYALALEKLRHENKVKRIRLKHDNALTRLRFMADNDLSFVPRGWLSGVEEKMKTSKK